MTGQLHVGSSCNASQEAATGSSHQVGEAKSVSPHLPEWISARLPFAYRFIKFCLVGGSGVFVDMGILFLLADPRSLALNITLSKVCAAELAMINNFIWNERWTFRGFRNASLSTGGKGQSEVVSFEIPLFRRFLIFNGICGIGIGFAVLLLHLFHTWLGWNLYLSNLLAIALVTFWNFQGNQRWTWRA